MELSIRTLFRRSLSSPFAHSASFERHIIYPFVELKRCFGVSRDPVAQNVAEKLPVTVKDKEFHVPSNLKLADPSVLLPIPINKWETVQFQFPLIKVDEFISYKKFLPPSAGSQQEGIAEMKTALNHTIFKQPLRKDLVHELVRYIRAKRRQPKKTRRMSEMRGSNKKPRPQKKMGFSQVGNRRNSAWRGGFKAHGPVIRDYSIGMGKRQRALAMMSILCAKYREGNLIIFDQLAVPTHKTAALVEILNYHGITDDVWTLFCDDIMDENFSLAVRNLPKANAFPLQQLNGYEILRNYRLVLSLSAFVKLQSQLIYQYKEGGVLKAENRRLKNYMNLVNKGREILASKKLSSGAARA